MAGEHDSHLNGPPLQTMQSETVDLTSQATTSLSLSKIEFLGLIEMCL